MLTETQREMIEERKLGSNDQKRKKYIDYTLRQYAKKQLDSIDGLLEVLEALPDTQIKKVITAEHALNSLDLLKKIVLTLDLAPIEADSNGIPCAVYRFKMLNTIPEQAGGQSRMLNHMKFMFLAKPEEVELAKNLGPMKHILNHLFETDQDVAGYEAEDWNWIVAPRINEISERRGQKIYRIEIEEGAVVRTLPSPPD